MALKRAFLISFFAASIALAAAGAAGAQENPDYTAPAPVVEVTTPPTQNLSTPAVRSSAAPLALTGTDALQLVVAGGVLVAGGAGVLAVRRRTTA